MNENRCRGCFGKTRPEDSCKATCKDCQYEGANIYRCHTCWHSRHEKSKSFICGFRWNRGIRRDK